MNFSPLHTKIIEKKRINEVTIIRESPDNYPKNKSNIYAVNDVGDIVWFAELPIIGDIYTNPIQWNKDMTINANLNSFVVSSWKGITVSIDYKTGEIKSKKFTK